MAVSGREEEHKMEENKREEFLKQYWTAVLGQQADQLPLFLKRTPVSDGTTPGNNLP